MIGISVSDILKLLDQIPIWKQLKALPQQIADLQTRVAALEKQIVERPAAERCPMCETGILKTLKVTPHPVMGDVGLQERHLTCESCGHTEKRMYDPLGLTKRTKRSCAGSLNSMRKKKSSKFELDKSAITAWANSHSKKIIRAQDSFYLQYGKTLDGWSILENSVSLFFAKLTGMTPTKARRVFYSARSFNGRADMFEAALSATRLPKELHPF